MHRYRIDTFYLVALPNRQDQWHRRVRSFSQALTTYGLYTVEEVLAEYRTFAVRPGPISGKKRRGRSGMC